MTYVFFFLFTFCLLVSSVMNIKYDLFCFVFQGASGKRNTCVRVHKCASVCVRFERVRQHYVDIMSRTVKDV